MVESTIPSFEQSTVATEEEQLATSVACSSSPVVNSSRKNRFLRELRVIWALAEKRWRIDFRYPLALLYFSISPILWLLPQLVYGSALVGGRYSEELVAATGTNDVWVFTSLGLVFNMFVAITLWGTAFGIRREEWTGTFDAIYVAPINRTSIIFGNALKSLMQSSIGLSIQMGIIVYWY